MWGWCVQVPTCRCTQVCAHVFGLNIHENWSNTPSGEGICMHSKLLCQDYECWCQFEQMDPAQFTLCAKPGLIPLDFGSQKYKPNMCLSSLGGHLKLGVLCRCPSYQRNQGEPEGEHLFVQPTHEWNMRGQVLWEHWPATDQLGTNLLPFKKSTHTHPK